MKEESKGPGRPQKAPTKNLLIRISPRLYKEVHDRAGRDRRTLAATGELLLEAGLKATK